MDSTILDQVSAEKIRLHISQLEGIRHPQAAPEALEQAAAYIQSQLECLDYIVEHHLFEHEGREFKNILGTRRGALYPDERWLVVAHYDTVAITPGADDNASAVAVLLEIARVLAPLKPNRTLQFLAPNLEECQYADTRKGDGLYGSKAFAADAAQQGWQIKGVVVFDTIAYAGDGIPQSAPAGLPVKLPEAGNFIGAIANAASKELYGLLMESIQQNQIALPVFPLIVPGNGEMFPDVRRSDHAPFWDKGYPALFLTDTANFRNPNYHQPSDTLDTLNIPFAANVCRAVAGMVAKAIM